MSKRFPALVTIASTAGIIACTGTTANDRLGSANTNGTPVLPTTFTLAAGASTDIASANLRIRFDSVIADSRCPSNVQCIQAGSAIVALTVAQLSGVMSAQLLSLSTIAGKDTATSYGQPVRLLNVLPVPVTTTPTQPSAYRIELKVGAAK